MGDDVTGVNADPDVKTGILQQFDAPDQLDGRMTGHDGVIVVRVRCTKQRDQPIAALLADDTAIAPDRRAHRDQGRLKP